MAEVLPLRNDAAPGRVRHVLFLLRRARLGSGKGGRRAALFFSPRQDRGAPARSGQRARAASFWRRSRPPGRRVEQEETPMTNPKARAPLCGASALRRRSAGVLLGALTAFGAAASAYGRRRRPRREARAALVRGVPHRRQRPDARPDNVPPFATIAQHARLRRRQDRAASCATRIRKCRTCSCRGRKPRIWPPISSAWENSRAFSRRDQPAHRPDADRVGEYRRAPARRRSRPRWSASTPLSTARRSVVGLRSRAS